MTASTRTTAMAGRVTSEALLNGKPELVPEGSGSIDIPGQLSDVALAICPALNVVQGGRSAGRRARQQRKLIRSGKQDDFLDAWCHAAAPCPLARWRNSLGVTPKAHLNDRPKWVMSEKPQA